ncbi:MAG: betaine--homocysteine S-methyltransferase [Pseudomonadota bacterium]
MTDLLSRLLAERPWLLADGATGTNFFAAGLQTGDAPELWNVEHPERVRALHDGFVAAGSDIILTNSFGGTRHRLKLHQAQGRVVELNRRAAEIARESADASGREVVVAGSVGPTGEILVPLGPLSIEDAAAAFEEQARGLAEGGADVLWIETMSSVEELGAAVEGAGRLGLPLATTMSFDTNGRTMMGVTAGQAVGLAEGFTPRPLAVGGNCGTGPGELMAVLIGMAESARDDTVLIAKSNCGIPEYVDGEIRYSGTPELMAEYACLARDLGVRIIGGCCGTTADHVAIMREALESRPAGPKPTMKSVVATLGSVSAGAEQQGENPLGDLPEPSAGRGRRRGRRRGGGDGAPRF